MTAFQIKTLARDVRREDALIPSVEFRFFRELFQFFGDDCAAREEHWQSRAHIVVENE